MIMPDKQTIDNLARESFLRLTNGSENADNELFYRHGFAEGFTKCAEIVVDDMTQWRDCDRNTENPGEEYYKLRCGWVLVKMENRISHKEYEIPSVAKFDKVKRLWTFSIGLEQRGLYRELKVVKWRPIH